MITYGTPYRTSSLGGSLPIRPHSGGGTWYGLGTGQTMGGAKGEPPSILSNFRTAGPRLGTFAAAPTPTEPRAVMAADDGPESAWRACTQRKSIAKHKRGATLVDLAHHTSRDGPT